MVKVEGEDMEIAFNHAFLLDGLMSVTAETLKLEMQTPLKPGLLKTLRGRGLPLPADARTAGLGSEWASLSHG